MRFLSLKQLFKQIYDIKKILKKDIYLDSLISKQIILQNDFSISNQPI